MYFEREILNHKLKFASLTKDLYNFLTFVEKFFISDHDFKSDLNWWRSMQYDFSFCVVLLFKSLNLKRKQGHIGRWGLLRKEDQKNERIENSKTLRVISKQEVKVKLLIFLWETDLKQQDAIKNPQTKILC